MSQFQSKQQATPAAGSSNQKVATAASASTVAVAVAASSVAELMTGYPQDAKTGKRRVIPGYLLTAKHQHQPQPQLGMEQAAQELPRVNWQ